MKPGETGAEPLSHIDGDGRAHMVDVTEKAATRREALARGSVYMQAETLARIEAGGIRKGDVISIAELAGIMGAKRTADLIPLCHPLPLSSVKLRLSCDRERSAVDIEARCRTTGPTGVEMEALTAVSVAALTIYDMAKAMDRGMRIGDIRLLEKSGGRSGEWRAEETAPHDKAGQG